MSGPPFRLAHLSDPHLPFDPCLARSQRLAFKQWLALVSWWRKRRLIGSIAAERALHADLLETAPDHVAVTGDLVNLGLKGEYESALGWLETLGPQDRVSVVPGNHDLTAPILWSDGPGRWHGFMRGDTAGAEPFPWLRRRGPVALLGLCSALPTRPGSAAGRLGHRQLGRAAALLDQAAAEGLFRVVLIHHPPVRGPGGCRKALRDRAAMLRLLRRHGAELVLHGHHHRTSLSHVAGPAGPIPMFGVPAARAGIARPELAGWLLHTVERHEGGWRLDSLARRFDPATGRFHPHREWTHHLPAQ